MNEKRKPTYQEIIKLCNKKDKEIERLNNKVEELMTLYTTERNVKEDYKSIIKEVREYLKLREDDNSMCSVCGVMSDSLLEILEKENK